MGSGYEVESVLNNMIRRYGQLVVEGFLAGLIRGETHAQWAVVLGVSEQRVAQWAATFGAVNRGWCPHPDIAALARRRAAPLPQLQDAKIV